MPKSKRLKPISLQPLTPEQALRAFLRIDPKELKRLEQEEKQARSARRPQ